MIEISPGIGGGLMGIEKCERPGHEVERFRGTGAVRTLSKSPGRELWAITRHGNLRAAVAKGATLT